MTVSSVVAERALATAAGLAASRTLPTLPDAVHPVALLGSVLDGFERRWWRDRRWAGVGHAVTVSSVVAERALATAAGLAASRTLPTLPDAVHPVALLGSVLDGFERRWWRDRRWAGVVHATVGGALGAAAGRLAGTTSTVAVSASGEQLRRTASDIGHRLEVDDLAGARAALPGLVGRDPAGLDGAGIAAAVIESVAENTVDGVFAPAFWALVAGGAGAGAHRAVNTMDAMVGRRTARHERYGWASARADDVAAYVPARLFAVALATVAPDRRGPIRATVRRDAAAHPSPNAGVAEAAMAGALGRRLGGPLRYAGVLDDRPVLGEGPRPDPDDIARAVVLSRRTEELVVAVLGVFGVAAVALGGVR